MKIGIKYENDKLLVLAGMHFEEYKKIGIDLGISDVPYLLVYQNIIKMFKQYFSRCDKTDPVVFEDEPTFDNIDKFIKENYNMPCVKTDENEL